MRFLRGLTKNNDRTWFEERRPVYERAVKAPLLAVIEEINAAMDAFAPEHVRPPNKIALRIYRDTRFSPDKRPYKIHLGAWWARRGLGKDAGAGFYLDIGPQRSYIAAGLYAPEREALLTVRRWMAEHHERYRTELAVLLRPSGRIAPMTLIEPNALTRNPAGFAPDHPAGDLLRARNWGVTLDLSPEAPLASSFAATVSAHLRRTTGLVALLNEPLTRSLQE